MTAVVPHTMATCAPADPQDSGTEVPRPSAAIAISRPQRGRLADAGPDRCWHKARAVDQHQHKKHDGEDRHRNFSVLRPASTGKPPPDPDDDGQEQEHAEQLDDDGCVAGGSETE